MTFCFCGHVAIKSDATAAIGMVHWLGLGNVRHWAVGDLWVPHHVRSGKNSSLQNVRLGESERCANQVSWAEPLLSHTRGSNWVLVGVESRTGKPVPEAEASQN